MIAVVVAQLLYGKMQQSAPREIVQPAGITFHVIVQKKLATSTMTSTLQVCLFSCDFSLFRTDALDFCSFGFYAFFFNFENVILYEFFFDYLY